MIMKKKKMLKPEQEGPRRQLFSRVAREADEQHHRELMLRCSVTVIAFGL